MKRAVGFCEDPQCGEYMRGCFLLGHGDVFICPECRQAGVIERERGESKGQSNYWKEVRIEFNYDPILKEYRGLAVLTDNSLRGEHNVYTLKSPLIKTEKRALKLAEVFLANLQGYQYFEGEHEIRALERRLSFDDPIDEFKRNLNVVSKNWEGLRAD